MKPASVSKAVIAASGPTPAADHGRPGKPSTSSSICSPPAVPRRGESNAWLMPGANTETMNGQLADLGKQLPDKVHVALVFDGAGWHHSHGLKVPDNITLVHLQPYSPELNPIEIVWHELRQRYLSNRIFPQADCLQGEVALAWNRLADNLRRLRSLTDYAWIQDARDCLATQEI